jgi:hypothetical protein
MRLLVLIAAMSLCGCRARTDSAASESPVRDSTIPALAVEPLDSLERAGLESLVGLTIPGRTTPVLHGASSAHLAGWLLHIDGVGPLTDYGISRYLHGTREYLVFEKLGRDSSGVRTAKVLDAIWAPVLPPFEQMSPCAYGQDLADHGIMALTQVEEAEWRATLRMAWRADSLTSRFVLIPTAGLACKDDAWGV